MSFVSLQRDGDVVVVVIDNPPVNAMSPGVPSAIADALRDALDDEQTAAVVLRGARGLLAGADIAALGTPWPAGQPTMRDLFPIMEGAARPVVALIDGQALGGGLELAMACHWRVATPQARLGQPEVTLGMPPGAGGTQRLPRLVGVAAALEMITSGQAVTGRRAAGLGLVDHLVPPEAALDAAIAFARDVARRAEPLPRARDRPVPPFPDDLFGATRDRLSRRSRGATAALRCVDAVEAATRLPFDEGVREERRMFDAAVASPEAAALRHLFLAERAARRVPGVTRDTQARSVAKVAVIGAGTMGTGIAIAFAEAGLPTYLMDADEKALARASAMVAKSFDVAVAKGRLGAEDAARRAGLVHPVRDFSMLGDADLVVEAVFEEMQVKKTVFEALDRHCRPGAILASNSSYLDLNALADHIPARRGSVLGMHFFAPANIMTLLEVVRTGSVAPEVLKAAIGIGTRLGKKVVVAGVCHGFLANRMFATYIREAQFLLEDGSLPDQVDAALTAFGMPMGPFQVKDLSGLEVSWRIRNQFPELRRPKGRYSLIDDMLCDAGRFGQRTGAGYYRYEAGSRTPVPDPEVTKVILAAAEAAGIDRRDVPADEIIDRCLLMAVNEGAKELQEGIALRASDIDLAWVHAYGFPAHRGGPMYWADQRGVRDVLARIEAFDRAQDYWTPAPLLRELAERDESFGDFDRRRSGHA